jgi:hypothetical protein
LKQRGVHFAKVSQSDRFTRSTPTVFDNLQEASQRCFVIDQKEAALY